MNGSEQQQPTQQIADWTGGVRNKRNNPLWFPENAVYDGENVDIVGGYLKTRQGASYSSSGSLPSGTVQALKQIYFPTNDVQYLLAQVETGSANKLYVSTAQLPSAAVTFTEIYSLGAGANPVSITTLADRAIITEGLKEEPLVFLGCQSDTGADWAVPKNVLFTYDGINYYDTSDRLCDKDPDTFYSPSAWPTSGHILVCCDVPKVSGIYVQLGQNVNTVTAAAQVYGSSGGAWAAVSGLVDNTSVNGKTMARSGTLTFNEYTTEYRIIYGVAGYWFKIAFSAQLRNYVWWVRFLFKAPCQPLANIGLGQPALPLTFLYCDTSAQTQKDFTVEVSDNIGDTVAYLNDGEATNPTPMGPSDYIYIGALTLFNAVMLEPHKNKNNNNVATLSAEFWREDGWQPLPITDGTSESGKTLRVKGLVTFAIPGGWRDYRPLNGQYPTGWYIRLKVSANLSEKSYISECRVHPVPKALVKHRFAITVRDRICLLSRPDAPDQVDISRSMEEYGFSGEDSMSLRIGGQDDIVGAAEVFNQGFIAKAQDWYILNGYNPATFAAERAETGNQAPINNNVIIRLPFTEADEKNKQGLCYINQAGAWYFTGLQAYQLSQAVNWWDPNAANPKLDLNYLYLASGVYWPERQWAIWSVPMITGAGTSQTTCNRLIIYDLTLQAWLPPMTITAASLCTAYHYLSGAPGNRGQLGLYAGDYSGRVARLFGPEATDFGAAISAWVVTGWLHFGSPNWEKQLRALTYYGKGDAITMYVYTNGDDATPAAVLPITELAALSVDFAKAMDKLNIKGLFYKFKIAFTGVASLYGLGLEWYPERDWNED